MTSDLVKEPFQPVATDAPQEIELPEKLISCESAPVRICFVCTGNTCRSPMAAALLNQLGLGTYEADSAGLFAAAGELISQNAVAALETYGVECTPKNNYKNHRARQAELDFLAQFDKIIAISRAHMMSLIMHFPEISEKIAVMPRDIPDPFMQSKEIYTACLESIAQSLKEMFAL